MRWDMARCMSRWFSRSAMAWRLSCWALPLQMARVIFAKPPEK